VPRLLPDAQVWHAAEFGPLPLSDAGSSLEAGTATLTRMLTDPRPLAWDPQRIVYTDGSVIKLSDVDTDDGGEKPPGIGAGVYVPAGARRSGRPGAAAATEIAILPTAVGQPENQTINRAELCAIYAAVLMLYDIIATDSLGAIDQIRKALLRPQDLLEHRHRELILAIARAIARRSPHLPPLKLIKVPAHVGIRGNEAADRIATGVANGRRPDNTRDTLGPNYTNPASNDRTTIWWPHTLALPPRPGAGTGPAPTPPASRKRRTPDTQDMDEGHHPRDTRLPIPNMVEYLKRLALSRHGLSGASLTGHYYSAWSALAERRHKASAHFMVDNGNVTYKERKTALQWFAGVLPTFHNLYKWRLTDSTTCRLCNAADDTQGHAINECPEHQGQRTERHHRAGRAILKTIARGAQGGCIVSADLGSEDNCQADGVKHYPTLAQALPRLMSEQERRALPRWSVPDIVMHTTDEKTGRETIHLVELKYCRDNAPEDVAQAAQNQHAGLMQAIRTSQTARPHAHRSGVLHKFALGVGGSVYQDMEASLRTLGVDRAAAADLLRTLNAHAVRSLKEIWATRQRTLKARGLLRLPKRGVG
jgi:ribonuclease HI